MATATVSPTATERAQEQAANLETGVILVNASEMQLDVYKQLQSKYRVPDTLESLAAKGFNQAVKSVIASNRNRQKTLHSDAIRAKNDRVAAQAAQNITELDNMEKFLR